MKIQIARPSIHVAASIAVSLGSPTLAGPEAPPVPAGDPPAAAAASTAQDAWPQSRGPTRNGRFTGPTWPSSLQEDHLRRRWAIADLGPSYASPVITADRVFSVETADAQKEIVRAFDRETGEEVWRTSWEGAMKVPFFASRNGSWVRSSPAFDGEHLYVGGMRDVLVCVAAATGEVRWKVDFVERFDSGLPAFGFVSSPLVADGRVYVQAGGSLVTLDARTGETTWRALAGADGMDSAFSSPIIATLDNVTQLVAQTRAELVGVAPGTGDVLWRRPVRAFRGMNILTPTVVQSAVFTAAYGGRAQLLDIRRQDDEFVVSERWNLGLQGYMTSPVIVDGHAYFFTRSNRLACVRLHDGVERWISGPTGDTYWSLVAQGDRILALNDTGRLRLIRANPDAFEVIDEIAIADDQTWASLAIAGRDVVVREQHGLAAFRWE